MKLTREDGCSTHTTFNEEVFGLPIPTRLRVRATYDICSICLTLLPNSGPPERPRKKTRSRKKDEEDLNTRGCHRCDRHLSGVQPNASGLSGRWHHARDQLGGVVLLSFAISGPEVRDSLSVSRRRDHRHAELPRQRAGEHRWFCRELVPARHLDGLDGVVCQGPGVRVRHRLLPRVPVPVRRHREHPHEDWS